MGVGATDAAVAFQGEPGAYSEEAVLRFFGPRARPVPCRDFGAVGEAVAAGDVTWGLLPIENTIAGSVVGSYDVLASTDLAVVGEVIASIHHCLLGLPGARLDAVTRVLSHPVALAQCTRFLRGQPIMEPVAVYDTAGAAREVAAAGDPGRAAIASRRAAALYGLAVLAADVEDRPDNQTRFLVVRSADGAASPFDVGAVRRGTAAKLLLLVETRNAPGALVEVLRPFADRRINLANLEVRPGAQPWSYRFFIEVEASADAEPTREALAEVRERAELVRVLGGFPRWN